MAYTHNRRYILRCMASFTGIFPCTEFKIMTSITWNKALCGNTPKDDSGGRGPEPPLNWWHHFEYTIEMTEICKACDKKSYDMITMIHSTLSNIEEEKTYCLSVQCTLRILLFWKLDKIKKRVELFGATGGSI